jgi:parallel beta-helix repeat protein
LGIYAESGLNASTSKAGTSTVTVEDSSVHDFMKNGITGNQIGTTLNVIGNQVRGQGPTTGAAENGIQIAFGAKGEAVNNSVSDVVYSPCVSTSSCAATATGILVYDSSNILLDDNHVANTQGAVGIDADGEFFCEGGTNQGANCTGLSDNTTCMGGGTCTAASANDETVENNVVNGSLVFDAIDVCGSNGSTVTGNTVSNSGQSAIHLDSTCSSFGGPVGGTATVGSNILNEACAGILDGSAGNTINTNTYNNLVNTTLAADTASCTVPSGGDAVAKLTADSGQKSVRPQVMRP